MGIPDKDSRAFRGEPSTCQPMSNELCITGCVYATAAVTLALSIGYYLIVVRGRAAKT
jgi:hypothetical protein